MTSFSLFGVLQAPAFCNSRVNVLETFIICVNSPGFLSPDRRNLDILSMESQRRSADHIDEGRYIWRGDGLVDFLNESRNHLHLIYKKDGTC